MVMKVALLVLGFLLSHSAVRASSEKVIMASDLSPTKLAAFLFEDFEQEASIEFREGDQLPIKIQLSGDLFTTITQGETVVQIDKGFFLKKDGDDILMSWDGSDYQPFKELVGGKLSVGASGSTPGQADQILLGAEINER
jgi:hypothetical protein